MATKRTYGASGKSGSSSSGRSTSSSVSAARLHQKSGPANTFGGYTKVSHTNGTFSMRKSGK